MTKTPETQVSESIAESVQPDANKFDASTEFKVAEVRDGQAILELGDGRMFPVALPDGAEVKKRNTVKIKAEHLDRDGVPVNATFDKVV